MQQLTRCFVCESAIFSFTAPCPVEVSALLTELSALMFVPDLYCKLGGVLGLGGGTFFG